MHVVDYLKGGRMEKKEWRKRTEKKDNGICSRCIVDPNLGRGCFGCKKSLLMDIHIYSIPMVPAPKEKEVENHVHL